MAQVCRMVGGDTRYGAATAWYGAGMAHKLVSARITVEETCLHISELYLEPAFLLYSNGCAVVPSLIHTEMLRSN